MKAARLLLALAAAMLLVLGLVTTVTAQTSEKTQVWLKFEAPLGGEWKHGPYASREEAFDAQASFEGSLNGERIVNLRIAEGADPFPQATHVTPPSGTPQQAPEPVITPAPTPTPIPTPMPVNKPPVITTPKEGAKFQVRIGETLQIHVNASDPEGKALTYALLAFPNGMTHDAQTGVIQWTPDERFTGEERQVTFGVHDGRWSNIMRRTIFVTVSALPTLSHTPTPAPVPTTTLAPTPTPTPISTPTPIPTLGSAHNPGNQEQDANNQDARELEQLIEDINEEVEKLQQELEQQNKFLVLGVGGLAGYVYPYSGITPDNFTFSKDLWWGSWGEDVRNLQIFLNNTGCVVSTINSGSPGNETDYFGLFTWQAVHCFQRKYANEILTSWGLGPTESTGYFGSTSRTKANQLLAEARVKRLQPIFEGGTIGPWSCQGCDRLSPEEREERQRMWEQAREDAFKVTPGPIPFGVVGRAGLPVGKVILSTLKQKAGQVLSLIRTTPSKALPAAKEFMAMMRLVPKLSKEAIEYLAEHPGDILKLAKMVDKYGTEVLQYIRHKGFDLSQLGRHFQDHGRRLGVASEFEYELLAKKFLNRPAGGTLLTKVRPNGEMVRFDTITEYFGVKTSGGRIKTFYKPDPTIHGYRTNLDYFLAQ